MPPVFGTQVAVEDPLVVLRRRERDRALAVAQAQQGQLLAFEELLEHDLGLAEAPLGEEDVERDAGLALVLGDDHALPGRQHVGLEDRGIGRARDVCGGLVAVAKEDVRCGRHAGSPSSAPWHRPSSPRCERRPSTVRRRRCRPPRGRPPARPPAGPPVRRRRSRPLARARGRPDRRQPDTRSRRGRCPRCPAPPAARAAAGCARACGPARARALRRRRPGRGRSSSRARR